MAIITSSTEGELAGALGPRMPAGVATMIGNHYPQDPLSFNTDWAGTMPMWALALWARRGLPGAMACVRAWFQVHLDRDPQLTDEQFLKTYTGHHSRIIRGRHLPFTMYSGLFGLAFPCAELYLQAGDERAREVCIDIAEAILHRSRRNSLGMVAHDDHWEYDIPDAGFFAIQALVSAASVDAGNAAKYLTQAVIQLRTYVDVFLDRKLGLAKTILGPRGIGKTYWCRAQGWLIWSFTAVLRSLPADHPERPQFLRDLAFFAESLANHIGESGFIRAFANDAQSLPETTGTAMVATAFHEAARLGWLDRAKFGPIATSMWDFCKSHVTAKGGLELVYTEWALPAELYVESSKTVQYGPPIGALLYLAWEMSAE